MIVPLSGARRLLALLVLPFAASALGQGLGPPGGGMPTAPHYEVTYTGGTWHSGGLNGSTQGSFDGGGYGVQTGGVGLPPGAIVENPPGPGTADAEGPITAHFNWVPAGDTSYPPAVVVKEVVTAAYSHLGGGAGHCATGFGAHGLDPNQYGDSVTDVRYTIWQSPGASFSLPAPVNPTADVSQPGSPGGGAGSCGVSYVATVTPVTIESNFAVRTLQTGKADLFNFLVGQQADFRVECGPYTPQAFQWSLGSDFVRGVSLTGAGTTSLEGSTYPYYDRRETDSGFDPSVPTPSVFYEGLKRDVTVVCTLSLFDGTQNIGSVTVTRDVEVYAPTHQLDLSHGSCTIWDADDLGEHDAELAEARDRSVSRDGVKIRNSMALPSGSPFLAYQGQGQWGFAQLIVDDIVYDSAPYSSDTRGLDNTYPYSMVYEHPSNSKIDPPWLPTGPGNYYLFDAPGISISGTHQYSRDFQADSYGVFRPPHFPGQATVDLPTFVVHWDYSSSSDRLANNPTGTARWANESSYHSFTGSSGTEWIATPSFSSLIMSTPRTPVASTEMDWSHVNMNN